ncbi:MAG: Small-conductance mechanosensitive channel [Candidatus Bipolaricaulis sibiricus]|uniref:Small-conductance mechanosensitive channel n=1 Tax=Bipolaricaulis sibiricus TaxID=2501609 RepID=A0A410FSF8_BIPS1|nr:MAG: Small-conductance mechanosensitive channel [Candidatus Bipolaricaulis sibiricus]
MTWEKIMEWGATHGVNLLAALAILVVGYFVARIARRVVRQLLNRAKVDATVSSFVTWLVYFGILVVALVATLARFGIETASFVALFGAVAFAIGFALQGALSNFAAGVLILIFRPYKVGDFVHVGPLQKGKHAAIGTVREIQLFTTEIVSSDNMEVLVPNAQVLSNIIRNASAFATRRIELPVEVSPSLPVEDVTRSIQSVAQSDKRVLADPPPEVLVSEIREKAVVLLVRLWVSRDDFDAVQFDLLRGIKTALEKGKD